jgi:catalase
MKPMTYSSSKHKPTHWRAAVATLSTLLVAAAAWSQSSSPKHIAGQQTPQDLVDALHAAFGEHHARAVHAKGIVLDGSFTPAKAARALSRSPIFEGGRLPVIVRFSDFTGIPDIPDTVGDANPRGFAIKIKATSGDVDVVTHSFNGFPVATSDEFAVFLRAIGASGAGVAHPTPIEQFLDGHPIAKAFVTSQPPPPESYATIAYFGVNSFKFTTASGRSAFVRYRLVPRAGSHYLTTDAVKTKGPDYLIEELRQRLMKTPVVFDWYAQIAQPGDKIDDPSIAWPETRERTLLGTITITRLADAPGIDAATLFLPGTTHPGIDPADPMLTLRNNAYPISFKKRQ